MTNNKSLGNRGEQIAQEYLQRNGYNFIDKNYRSGRQEIDLIFKNKKEYIFIEVKTRTETGESKKENPLTSKQTKNLRYAIINYCLANHIALINIRLDLIIILINKKARRASLKHYKNIL